MHSVAYDHAAQHSLNSVWTHSITEHHAAQRRCDQGFGRAYLQIGIKQQMGGDPMPAGYLKEWFGTEVNSTLPPGPKKEAEASLENLKNNHDKRKEPMLAILEFLGYSDRDAFLGELKPRRDYLTQLEVDRSWVPPSMQQLMLPSAFPGAAWMVEFQVPSSVTHHTPHHTHPAPHTTASHQPAPTRTSTNQHQHQHQHRPAPAPTTTTSTTTNNNSSATLATASPCMPC